MKHNFVANTHRSWRRYVIAILWKLEVLDDKELGVLCKKVKLKFKDIYKELEDLVESSGLEVADDVEQRIKEEETEASMPPRAKVKAEKASAKVKKEVKVKQEKVLAANHADMKALEEFRQRNKQSAKKSRDKQRA